MGSQDCGNGPRQLILQREDVCELAVVAFGPPVGAGHSIDELRCKAYSIAFPANAAFQDVSHTKFAANLADVD